jgi:hypothetical protein
MGLGGYAFLDSSRSITVLAPVAAKSTIVARPHVVPASILSLGHTIQIVVQALRRATSKQACRHLASAVIRLY